MRMQLKRQSRCSWGLVWCCLAWVALTQSVHLEANQSASPPPTNWKARIRPWTGADKWRGVDEAPWDDTMFAFKAPECVGPNGLAMSPKRAQQCCANGVIKEECSFTGTQLLVQAVDLVIPGPAQINDIINRARSLDSSGLGADSESQIPQDALAEFADFAGGQSNAATADRAKASGVPGQGGPKGGLSPEEARKKTGGFLGGMGGILGRLGFGTDGTTESDDTNQSGAALSGAAESTSLSATYSQAGGAGKNGSGTDSGRGPLYSGEGAGSAISPSSTSYGEGMGAVATASGSPDPDDYFARTDINLSLFRQITRRMREKEPTLVESVPPLRTKAP